MSEFKETVTPKDGVVSEQHRETDRPKMSESDVPRMPHATDVLDVPFSESSDIFNEIFKQYGLVDASTSEKSETNQTDTADGNDYSQYLEKREDGKYYDKETGRSYDSIEAWKRAQETLAKRYEGTANYYEEKAKKEWARFKNSEANGESDAEKWEHYRRSQEYYAKAKECKEKAEKIRARLGNDFSSEKKETNSNEIDEQNSLVESVPTERQKAVRDLCSDAPDKVKDVINRYGEGIIVEDTTEDFPVCHYDRRDMVIRMEDNLDDEEYAEILSHEFGHFVDHQKEDVSRSPEFRDAVAKDLEKFNQTSPAGGENFSMMLDELMESDVAYDRSVTDNLSAYFKNDPSIMTRFNDEGISYYGHPNEYWNRDGSQQCEIYANCFSMFAQNNTESCDFMTKYFPNTWNSFLNTL